MNIDPEMKVVKMGIPHRKNLYLIAGCQYQVKFTGMRQGLPVTWWEGGLSENVDNTYKSVSTSHRTAYRVRLFQCIEVTSSKPTSEKNGY